MNKRHERRIERLLELGKKNRFMKIIALSLIFLEILRYHLCIKVINNPTRVASFVTAGVLFMVASSFITINPAESLSCNSVSSMSFAESDIGIEENPVAQSTVINAVTVSSDSTPVFIEETEEILDNSIDSDLAEFQELSEDEISVNLAENVEAAAFNEAVYEDADSSAESEAVEIPDVNIEDFDSDEWYLILVNKMHPIPDDYDFTLSNLDTWGQMDERVCDSMNQMISAAHQDGIGLAVVSAYRSNSQQIDNFNKHISQYMSMGYSYSESYQKTSKYVTIPGTSEHEMGISADILSYDYMSMNQGFADTDSAEWLKEHAWEYGFILRYPEGKEDITGIVFEPWHFRYVGIEAAYYITSNDLTLEEFIDLLNER